MSDEQPVQKASKHICLTNRHALGISDDPEHDMLIALADKDVLTLARGLSKEEARSPTGSSEWTDPERTRPSAR